MNVFKMVLSSIFFQAVDSVEYKWKAVGHQKVLMLRDQPHADILAATFNHMRRGLFVQDFQGTSLSVNSHALPVADEIVIMAICFEHNRCANASSSSGGQSCCVLNNFSFIQ